MTGEYLVFKKKDAAMRYIEANPGCGLRLFNEDYDETAGAKRQILSTADVIYSKIFTKSGSLRKGDHNRYEYLDEKCKFGIDADLMTQGSLYTPDFDCRPKLREFMQKVNTQMDEVFSIKLTSRDWIILRSDYKHPTPKKQGKHSYHLILLGYYFDTMTDMRDFAALIEDPDIDRSFYQRRPCRMLGNTKKGQMRPLKPYKMEESRMPNDFACYKDFFLATLLHESRDCKRLELPREHKPATPAHRLLRQTKNDTSDVDIQELIETKESTVNLQTIAGLVQCMSVARATEYAKWIQVGFALGSAASKATNQELFSIYDCFSQTAENYDSDAVLLQWKYSVTPSARDNPITVGSLFKWAKQDDPEGYKWVIKTAHIPEIIQKDLIIPFPTCKAGETVSNAFGDEEGLCIDYSEYDDRYMRSYPIDNYDGIIAVGGMGSGKTSKNIEVMQKFPRMLKVSPRRLYTMDVKTRLRGHGVPVETYLDHRDEFDLSGYDQMIVSPESCWKIWKNREYDSFIGDEIESIMDSLTCETTHVNMPGANMAFMECIVKAQKFVLSDAHLSMKTLEYVRGVFKGTKKRILLVRNTRVVNKRTALHLRHKCTSSRQMHRYWKFEIQMIIDDINAGKNLVVFTANKKGFGDALLARIKSDNVLQPDEFSYYHKDNTSEEDAKMDVNIDWMGKRLIMYTPVITVGCSFDIKGWFLRVYAYLSCKSINVKGSLQATARVRDLVDNKMIFMIDDRPVRPCKYTLSSIAKAKKREKKLKQQAYEKEVRSATAMTVSELRSLTEGAGDPSMFLEEMRTLLHHREKSPAVKMPEIDFKTFCYNELENDLDHAHFTGNFYRLMREAGYKDVTIEDVVVDEDVEDSGLAIAHTPMFSFSALPLLSREEYSNLRKDVRYHCTISRESKWAMQKYCFVELMINSNRRKVTPEDQNRLFDDYMTDEKHRQWLFNAYNHIYRGAQDVMEVSLTRCPYEEISDASGAVMSKMKEFAKITKMNSVLDFDVLLDREFLERHKVRIMKLLLDSRTLLGCPAKPAKNPTEFRRLQESLNVVYMKLFGLKFENTLDHGGVIRQGKKTIREGRYALIKSDEFSELLYSCGLFNQK
ncbi:hypothetical protein CVIRNUC_003620 [Coccomyxa viridis]|uniref:Uncharacterized protein n=1 Tax=Coccomyxa viridis TaxID=1274662 RepID=A0AAV1I1T5_9CHLO|nr:hypothetical protein CVIRNUC_003620 [Coccomyxa viridis]